MILQATDTVLTQREWFRDTFNVDAVVKACRDGSILTYIPSVYIWEEAEATRSIWRPYPLLAFGSTKEDSLSSLFEAAVCEIGNKDGYEVFSIFRPRQGQDASMIGRGRAHEIIYSEDKRHNHDPRDPRVFDFQDVSFLPETRTRLPLSFEKSHCHAVVPGY